MWGGLLSEEDRGWATSSSRRVTTEEVINPLRRRMVEDMTIRNFDPRAQQELWG